MSYRTQLSSISYRDATGNHVRLYYVDGNDIYEISYDNGEKGQPTSILPVAGTARLDTRIAAIAWNLGKMVCSLYSFIEIFYSYNGFIPGSRLLL